MSEEHIVRSLAAVEEALSHFERSLTASGFEAGAASYRKMAEVVVGQWLWVDAQELTEYNERFRHIATLAARVHEQLLPYVTAMRQLAALQELVPPPPPELPVDPDSPAGRVFLALRDAPRPLSITALRRQLGGTTRALRETVSALVEAGLVTERRAGSRILYAAAETTP